MLSNKNTKNANFLFIVDMWKIKSRKAELTLFSLIPAPISTNREMRFYP